MGIAWFVARKNATPQIAAILPGAEKLDEHGSQAIPPGMWIVPLPFADDIRQNPETNLIRAPENLIDLMRNVVQQLQLPKARYDPSKYPNPCRLSRYKGENYIERIGLTFCERYNGTTVYFKLWLWARTSPISLMTRQYRSIDKSIR